MFHKMQRTLGKQHTTKDMPPTMPPLPKACTQPLLVSLDDTRRLTASRSPAASEEDIHHKRRRGAQEPRGGGGRLPSEDAGGRFLSCCRT